MNINVETTLGLLGGLGGILALFGKYLSSLLQKKKEDTELSFEVNILKGKVKALEEDREHLQTKLEKIAILEERIRQLKKE